MIDIHSHILPGIDDGPANFSQFLDLVNMATFEGITHLYATPHHMNGKYHNKKQKILDIIQYCNKLIAREGFPLVIHPGQELRIHRNIFETITKDEILTLDNKGKFLLLELPSNEIPDYTTHVVYELVVKGITPIIVHPERNKAFQEEPHLLFHLIQEGVCTQLTAGSIIGEFGKKVKAFSEKLIEHRMTHFIASDVHNSKTRTFLLKEAYERVEQKFGVESTCYFKQNTELLLTGQNLEVVDAIPIRRRLFGLFR